MPAPVRTSGTSGPRWSAVFVWALASGVAACATTPNLQIQKVGVAVGAPANVAMYLKVTRPDGQPVTLLASDFKVYEDGKQIPVKKLKRALLPVASVLDRYVFVVVDLSGPLVDSEYLSTLQDSIANLADRLGKDSHLALSVFDGDGLKPFVTFEDADPKPGLAGMRRFRPHNRNIDLWGTYMTSLDALAEAARHSNAAQHSTTLIFVTDRKDKAGRHSLDEASTKLQASPSDSFVIGLGDAINKEELTHLGRPDAFFVDKFRDLNKPFDDVAERIEAQRGQDYVFAYCSLLKPSKRPATHKVEVRIGNKQWHGEVDHELSTKAFTKGGSCDPHKKPEFTAEKVGADDGGREKSEAGAADDDEAASKPKKRQKKQQPVEEESSADDSEGR